MKILLTVLTVLLITVAALLALIGILLFVPITLYLAYNIESAEYKLRILGIPINLKKKKSKKKKKQNSESSEKDTNKKLLASLSDLKEMLPSVFKYAKNAFVIKDIDLKIKVASDDPCDTAVAYGMIYAALGTVLSIIKSNITVKNADINVIADYAGDKTTLQLKVLFHSRVFKIVRALILLIYNKVITF